MKLLIITLFILLLLIISCSVEPINKNVHQTLNGTETIIQKGPLIITHPPQLEMTKVKIEGGDSLK